METKYTVLLPNGEERHGTVDWPLSPGYEAIKNLVEPIIGTEDYFEHVSILLPNGKRGDMFVNENGRMRGLPRNEKATVHYRRNWLNQLPGTHPESIAFIVGPAIVFFRKVWF